MSNFWYLIKQGFKNVFHNRMMSFSCIGVLVACMMLIGSAVLFSLTINNLTTIADGQSQIVAFLEKQASVNKVDEEFAKIPNIIEREFVSKDDRLEREKERYGENAVLLDGLEGKENPLSDMYILRVKDTAILGQTVAEVRAIKGIEKVNARVEVAKIMSGIKQTVYYAGASIVSILIVVSLVIITSTVKITIFSRRKEISIMKYVGATDGFIRLPFLVEGLVIGLSAACIAFFLLGIGYPYLIDWAMKTYGKESAITNVFFNNAASFDDIAMKLFGGFAALGAAIGLLSSTVFVHKHLRV